MEEAQEKGIDLNDLKAALDAILQNGARSEAILLIEASRRFEDCDVAALADAVSFLLRSQYAGMGSAWRCPGTEEEAEKLREGWKVESQRRQARLLRSIRLGRGLEYPNQFEVAEWIEEAARNRDVHVLNYLFPLLRRSVFTAERWFELERYVNESQKPLRELESDIEKLSQEAEGMRSRLYTIEQEIRSKQEDLRRLRGETAAGRITSRSAFILPILKALDDLGGSAMRDDVLIKVEQMMRPFLKESEYELLGDDQAPRWQRATDWARHRMAVRGLLKSDSPRGVWEISEAGRRFLVEHDQ